jgi:predicted phage tail protein
MGIFFALFYLFIVVAPWVGGWLAGWAGSARVTFDLGAAMLVAGCASLWLFEVLASKARRQRSHWVKSSRQIVVRRTRGSEAAPGGYEP